MTELICICCPMGCRMTVEKTADGFSVEGNSCPRGKKYAIEEMTAPVRTITSSVRILGGDCAMLSVKTDKPIAKELVFRSLQDIKGLTVNAPKEIGDIIAKNVAGTDVNFIATRKVEKI